MKLCSRSACERAAKRAVQADADEFDSSALDWGYRIGSRIYDAYLAGRATPATVRRLFLVHLDEPGVARKACAAVISKLRVFGRLQSRAAQA